jgi:hypothetical protein
MQISFDFFRALADNSKNTGAAMQSISHSIANFARWTSIKIIAPARDGDLIFD